MSASVRGLEDIAISLHLMARESMCPVTPRHGETREGTDPSSPGELQVQPVRILQGGPLRLQSQPEHPLLPPLLFQTA